MFFWERLQVQMTGPSCEEKLADAVKRVSAAEESNRLSTEASRRLLKWLTDPQYEAFAPRILELIEGDEFEKLDAMFWQIIPFGTGGRRGQMGEVGTATINDRTIAESAHGLAVYLTQEKQRHKRDSDGCAVVACDTRIRSPQFARLTATTLAAHGLKVYFFESHRSTPELSFAVRHLRCDVGVVISASHNPPSDNGFKAYWSDGGQVLFPHDHGIIECVYESDGLPTLDFEQAVDEGQIELIGESVDRAFVDAVLKMSLSTKRDVSAVFTPLHGAGETSVYRVLQEAGFSGVEIFEPHRKPDGRFPNVPDHLPNPERPQVFGPVIEYARNTNVDLILATDPDADRLGASAKNAHGKFIHLTGNQIGVLLTDYILRKRAASDTLTADHYVVQTLVTTPMVTAVAQSHGVRVIGDLLVGFKYIAETVDREGPDRFVFGAEESLGYLIGDYCRDKDAAGAALYLLELAAELRTENKSLLDRLDELYSEHGYFVESQQSEVCTGPRGQEQIKGLMKSLRQRPPTELGKIQMSRVHDFFQHEIRKLPENTKVNDLPNPDGNLLIFESDYGDGKITLAVRPSGTEPKIKFYFFAYSICNDLTSLLNLKDRTDATLQAFQDAVSRWIQRALESGN